MVTAAFYNLSTVCHYLTMNCLLNLCHYGHCCLLQSVYCLSLSHNELSVKSVSLWTLLSPTVCPLSVDNSQFTFFISVTLWPLQPTSVCPLRLPRTLPSLVQFLYVHCFILYSLQCLFTSHSTFSWFCVIMSIAASYALWNVCLI